MPFKSKRQWRAAMGGHIEGFDKEKAREWAHETKTPFKKLPNRAPAEKGKRTLRPGIEKKAFRGFHLVGRVRAQSTQDPLQLALKQVSDELADVADPQFSPNAIRGHIDAAREEYSEYKKRLLKKTSALVRLCTKIAMPGMPSITAATAAKAPTVGRFSGLATANSLKPPGRALSSQIMNPRRNLRQAMNAF